MWQLAFYSSSLLSSWSCPVHHVCSSCSFLTSVKSQLPSLPCYTRVMVHGKMWWCVETFLLHDSILLFRRASALSQSIDSGNEVRAAPAVRTEEAGTGHGGLSCCVTYPTEPLCPSLLQKNTLSLLKILCISVKKEVCRLLFCGCHLLFKLLSVLC